MKNSHFFLKRTRKNVNFYFMLFFTIAIIRFSVYNVLELSSERLFLYEKE